MEQAISAKGKKLEMDEVYQEPTSGMNLSLTIDINIQKSLERELDNAVSMFNPCLLYTSRCV